MYLNAFKRSIRSKVKKEKRESTKKNSNLDSKALFLWTRYKHGHLRHLHLYLSFIYLLIRFCFRGTRERERLFCLMHKNMRALLFSSWFLFVLAMDVCVCYMCCAWPFIGKPWFMGLGFSWSGLILAADAWSNAPTLLYHVLLCQQGRGSSNHYQACQLSLLHCFKPLDWTWGSRVSL